MARSEEKEADKEDHGVDQERFLPTDGITEEASEAGGQKMPQDPAAG